MNDADLVYRPCTVGIMLEFLVNILTRLKIHHKISIIAHKHISDILVLAVCMQDVWHMDLNK